MVEQCGCEAYLSQSTGREMVPSGVILMEARKGLVKWTHRPPMMLWALFWKIYIYLRLLKRSVFSGHICYTFNTIN